MSDILLKVDNVSKIYPGGKEAIKNLSFEVYKGEIVSVVGPSGVGKTTTIRLLSGLMKPSSGSVFVNGKRVEGPARGLAVVFQDYTRSLLPWLTVEANVAFPLVGGTQKIPVNERKSRVMRVLEAVGLGGYAHFYPWQLSGGMQQRVAIARAIAVQPLVLLMDEPFASVDALTRSELEDLTLSVHADLGVTIVFVTHDIDEAVYMADRVVVLKGPPGHVREVVELTLPRPRSQETTRSDKEFIEKRNHIRTILMSKEVFEFDSKGIKGNIIESSL